MTRTEVSSCLRDLQVIGTEPRISEEQMEELEEKKLIKRNSKTGHIWLTTLGVHTKTGQI